MFLTSGTGKIRTRERGGKGKNDNRNPLDIDLKFVSNKPVIAQLRISLIENDIEELFGLVELQQRLDCNQNLGQRRGKGSERQAIIEKRG